ncbi:MAG: rRNA maturation RNase YbeY [candidate division WOR-3 bacterium]
MRVSIFGTRNRRLIADVRRFARILSCQFPTFRGTINIVLVKDQYILALNRQFLRRNRPTDVLAFPLEEPPSPSRPLRARLLGEVYINRDAARRQAKEYQVTLGSELRRLALHGLLHLAGLSHRQMPVYEQELLGTN